MALGRVRVAFGAAALLMCATVTIAPSAGATPVVFPTQAMDGAQTVGAGGVVRVGYDFTMPGNHLAAKVAFRYASVTFDATCVTSGADVSVSVPIEDAGYLDPRGDGADWYPIADPGSARSYQGLAAVPDLCDGGALSLQRGGSFRAHLVSSDNTDPVHVRWHYSVNGSPGGWSTTQSFTVPFIQGQPAVPPTSGAPSQIVVKLDTADGYTISDLTSAFPVAVSDGGLASRGIYLVTPTDPTYLDDTGRLTGLAGQMARTNGVVYAQVNLAVHLADTQFHGWPWGSPTGVGADPSSFSAQPAARALHLAAAHGYATGAGVTVAVLDTGVDRHAPALAGRLLPGWNYLKDNADVRDRGFGANTSAVGHGTFVSGLIALVAPAAKIIPDRVLNGAGYGTIYGVAQAILDATAEGADVINLSFGTDVHPTWDVLQDAIAQARAAGVVVVAASGNDGDSELHYPAAQPEALSVAALNPTTAALSSFSDRGNWVDVAAPGEQVVGPVPGGGYATWAGTSMAAPFVSGTAALIKSAAPTMAPDKTAEAIEKSSDALSGHPIRFGALDVVAAVQSARSPHP